MNASVGIVLGIVPLIGCGGATPTISTPTARQVAEFVRNAKIELPASAQPIGWLEERGMDDGLWLQVKMAAEDLPAFLNSSPFRGLTLANNNPYDLTHFGLFLPTTPTRYRGGRTELPNARFLLILIDDDNAETATVYLMWHET